MLTAETATAVVRAASIFLAGIAIFRSRERLD
jgi:hypothetical protein